ncbi:MAG: biotin--[acetyl-CoA-carboxylase] ligase [Anaerolineales bacterium]
MMQTELETRLKNLPLGDIRFFNQISSTNDEAANWIKTGCADLSLVIANEQTAGRGRGGHKWFTPPGSALAFSVVLRVDDQINKLLTMQNTTRLNGLGALAVCLTLQKVYSLPAKIKWPNDILVNGKKFAGVLTETDWVGNELTGVVIGIGINVATESVPPADWDADNPHPYPATCVEDQVTIPVNRWDLLKDVLDELIIWRDQLSSPKFIQTWQDNLAFLGEWVQIVFPGSETTKKMGQIIGLEVDGTLRMMEQSGKLSHLQFGKIRPSDSPFGEFRLRPIDS